MAFNTSYYEYKIKNGDTLSGIVHKMFAYAVSDIRYTETIQHILALNPQIKNPNHIKAGDMLRLGVLSTTTPKPIKQPSTVPAHFITQPIDPSLMENFWALSWLEHSSQFLTVPGGIASGTMNNLLSASNIGLINEVSDQYAKYKSKEITRGQYDSRRKVALDKLKKNIGPLEKLLFGKKSTHQSIRIARGGGIPATANIARHADRLKTLAAVSKGTGVVLVGVGLTAACMQIANTTDSKEKNEIFVESIASTTMGVGLGVAVTAFLVSNPIGWGTAIVLAVGSSTLSYGSGKFASFIAYDVFSLQVDLVSGAGIDKICR